MNWRFNTKSKAYNNQNLNSNSNDFHIKGNLNNYSDWRKKMIFSEDLLTKIITYMNQEEYNRFNYLLKKIHYDDLNTLVNKLLKDKCIQKR